MKTIVCALFTVIMLSGCATERVVYRDREAAPAPRVVEPVQTPTCPSGTVLTYWHDPKLGFTRPICVTPALATEASSKETESFWKGAVTGAVVGIVGATVLQSLNRNQNRGYSHCSYGRCW